MIGLGTIVNVVAIVLGGSGGNFAEGFVTASLVYCIGAMGIGVAFAALPVLIYQGGITLLDGTIKPLLIDSVVYYAIKCMIKY